MSKALFIRNDDATTMDKSFRFFFDAAMDHGVPVIQAVIPGKMDQGLVRFLCRSKEKWPQLLDIVQHGWMHTNHSSVIGSKFEFGPSRDYQVQQSDIAEGQKKMRLAFGEYFTPAFVPPYHGYDQHTLQIIYEQGFKIFSAGAPRARRFKRMIELPALVSFTRYEEGKKSIKSARDVIMGVARLIYRRSLSGVLTHHADFKTIASRQELTLFFDRIAGLRIKEGWKLLLFSDLLSCLKGPNERA